jgi:hypothetical protein
MIFLYMIYTHGPWWFGIIDRNVPLSFHCSKIPLFTTGMDIRFFQKKILILMFIYKEDLREYENIFDIQAKI